jgi:ribokinase
VPDEPVSPQVTVVGSLNFDLTFHTRRYPHPGEAVAATGFHSGAGGKGLNQAIAAARQGVRAALIGCVGVDAAGDELAAALEVEQVGVAGLARIAGVATGTAAVVVSEGGENAIVVARGANDSLTEEHVHRHGRLVGDARVLLVQLEVPLDAVRAALEVARGASTLAILNAAPPREVPEDLLRLADLVVVNEGEAAALVGEPPPTAPTAATAATPDWASGAAAALVARGCAAAVVTVGARGAWFADHRRRLFLAPYAVDAVDTTGAGDAFCGSLAAALATGRSMPDALVRASAAGALAATKSGAAASLPTDEAVDGLIAAG